MTRPHRSRDTQITINSAIEIHALFVKQRYSYKLFLLYNYNHDNVSNLESMMEVLSCIKHWRSWLQKKEDPPVPPMDHQEIRRNEVGTNPSSPLLILWTSVQPSLSPSKMLNCSPSVMLSAGKFDYKICFQNALLLLFCPMPGLCRRYLLCSDICSFVRLPQDVFRILAVIIIWSLSYWVVLPDVNE